MPTRKSILKAVGIAVLIALVAYPLSYAPVVKWKWDAICKSNRGTGEIHVISYYGRLDSSEVPLYKPVDWLIDKTPLQKPLFLWARV